MAKMTAGHEFINFLYLDPAKGLIERRTSSFESYDVDFRRLLDCEMLETFSLSTPALKGKIDVWVDEDHLKKPQTGLWIETAVGVPCVAAAIFTGLPDNEGEATSCPLQPEELAKHLTAYCAIVNLDPFTARRPLETQIKDKLLTMGLKKYERLGVSV
jgi:hypothetical protein